MSFSPKTLDEKGRGKGKGKEKGKGREKGKGEGKEKAKGVEKGEGKEEGKGKEEGEGEREAGEKGKRKAGETVNSLLEGAGSYMNNRLSNIATDNSNYILAGSGF